MKFKDYLETYLTESKEEVLTFEELREKHSSLAKDHCLRLECVKCGGVETCRCSKPKIIFNGICNFCCEEK